MTGPACHAVLDWQLPRKQWVLLEWYALASCGGMELNGTQWNWMAISFKTYNVFIIGVSTYVHVGCV